MAKPTFETLSPEERNRLIQKRLLAKAAKAKTDPCAFEEFVLRNGDDGSRIKLAAVQELMLNFAMHARSDDGRRGNAVIIAPVEHTKSSTISVGLTLFKMAQNPSIRCGLVSAASKQAEKSLNSIRTYVEVSDELHLTNQFLRPSTQEGDPWTQSAITVDRHNKEASDATVQAFGIDTKKIPGSRLDWIVIDDLLNAENTRTSEQRLKVLQWAQSFVFSRKTPNGSIVVLNSALHPEDFCHYLCFKLRWPTMILDAYGKIDFHNTTFGCAGEVGENLIEPESPGSSACVLSKVKAAHPDDDGKQVLFPERFSLERLESIRAIMDVVPFLQSYRSQTRDDDEAMCKQEYIDKCKENGKLLGLHTPILGKIVGNALLGQYHYTGANKTFISVDLAVKQRDCNDKVAIAIVELIPHAIKLGEKTVTGLRVLLDLEMGRWPAPVIMRKIAAKFDSYGSNVTVVVEDVGAQAYIRQMMREYRTDIPIVPFCTDVKKHHLEYGVPGVFGEFANGAWAFPCTSDNRCIASVEELIKECLYYRPDKHTGDALMALYFARDQIKRYMSAYATGNRKGSYGMAITSR